MSFERREFLKLIGSVPIAGAVASEAASAASPAAGVPAFGFADDSVPMNAANLCPMPVAVTEAQARYQAALERSLSTASRKRIEAMKEDARTRIAALLGTSADELAIVRNTSEANNAIVQGVPLSEGDEVVLWDQNHPSNGLAWDVRALRTGATVRRFSVPARPGSVDELVDAFLASLSTRTRVLSFTHISNVTGLATPAGEIIAELRRRHPDVHVHIDGAQTWGAVDVNLKELDCDSFSASAHKWFMGPRETGLLYVRAERCAAIWPTIVSIPWFGTIEEAPKLARKFDALGQRDDAAAAALVDAVAIHEQLTPAGVEARSKAIADRLREGYRELGVDMVSTDHPEFTSSVVIARAPAERAAALVGTVFEEAGVQGAPTGGLRMSPHIYNTEAHVDRVLESVARHRDQLG
ncbi:MAG: aminotransferase class V-fold PLP-dependent enzyme [Pseudomonadota bacterium]